MKLIFSLTLFAISISNQMYSQNIEFIDTSFNIILENQYNQTTKVSFKNQSIYIVIFKASRDIGTEGVLWTRAVQEILKPDDIFYPIMENKKAFRILPLFLKKGIIKKHLREDLENPGIKNKKAEEIHPRFLQDWKNEMAKELNRTTNDVWILKIDNGKVIKKIVGNYSEEKFALLLDNKK